jgi:hypothetical protein
MSVWSSPDYYTYRRDKNTKFIQIYIIWVRGQYYMGKGQIQPPPPGSPHNFALRFSTVVSTTTTNNNQTLFTYKVIITHQPYLGGSPWKFKLKSNATKPSPRPHSASSQRPSLMSLRLSTLLHVSSVSQLTELSVSSMESTSLLLKPSHRSMLSSKLSWLSPNTCRSNVPPFGEVTTFYS